MTEAEVIDRINSTIKKNGKNAVTGNEMNFVLKAIIQLIADAGGVVNWGDIEGTIADQLDLIEQLADFVPYTGATNDVDLGDNDLNAEGIKIKGTAGNGHLNFKHQSTGATAGGNESVIYADNLGNPRWKNDGNALQEIALVDTILSKLGWFNILDQTPGTSSSGISNTISKSIALPSVPNKLRFRITGFRNSGSTNTFTIRAYLSEVNNNIGVTAVLIATVTGANSAVSFLPLIRNNFDIIGGNIIGFNANTSQVTDDVNLSSVRLNTPIPTGTPLYLILATQCVSASDTARIESVEISNF